MGQQLSIRPPTAASETSALASLALPLVGSLLQTYGIVWFLCRTPWAGTLTLPGLLRTAALFLLITAAAHLFAIWSNRRIFRREIHAPARLLIFVIWPSVLWLPLLILLLRENSVWMALIPPLIAASATLSLRRWLLTANRPNIKPPDAGPLSTLFHQHRPPTLLRAIAPAILTSVALQAAVVQLALDRPFSAGSLFAAATVLPVWLYPLRLQPFRPDQDTRSSLRDAMPRTSVVLLLLAVALLPYLKSSALARVSTALLRAKPPGIPTPAPTDPAGTRARDNSYSGVILVLPPKPKHQIIIPPPVTSPQFSALRNKPVIIPFDGAYWYFKQPDQRPKASAPVVRGDPRHKSIRSTNARPLSMEAHQLLINPVNITCCTAVHVAVENDDIGTGAIFVEVLLKHRTPKQTLTQPLGSVLIPSSQTPRTASTHPTDEILTFPIPRPTHIQEFDEIVVAIQPTGARARAGAHVSIQYFELIP